MQRNGLADVQIGWPRWIGYVVTVVLEAVLTQLLVAIEHHFPLGQFPIPYVVVIMLVAYLFGEGPALLALVLGFLSFGYFFVGPRHTLSPASVSAEGWASLVAYLIGAAIVGFASIMVRRSKRRIERLLNEVSRSNQRIQSLIENSPLAVIEWSADYVITRWSEEATRIFGWTAEETIGKRIDELSWVYEEDWDSVREVMADMMSGARPRNVNKNRNYRKDGSVIYCEWYNSTLMDSSGNLVSVLSLVLDVTERTLAEQGLRRYQLLSERARDTVLFIRRDGRIIEANRAAVEAYGYTHDELVTLSIQDLRAPESRVLTERQMQQADTEGILFETVHMRKDGGLFPVEVSSRGADVEGQRVLLSIIRDITERVRFRETLERQVVQLQRALLPAKPTIGGGYGIAAEYVPGSVGQEIGGDFYDVFETENGEMGILIGDVAGKGIKAAALAAATRSTVRAFAYDMSTPGEALAHANSVLRARETEPDTLVTVLLAVLGLRTGRMRYVNAGHPPALIYRSSDGQVEHLEFGRPPVVALETEDFEEHLCQLHPGDMVVFYTDGIPEARRGRQFFGIEGTERALRESGHLSPHEAVHRILDDAKDWSRGKLTDDVAIIVIQRPPAG